jgi:hypothetical protein
MVQQTAWYGGTMTQPPDELLDLTEDELERARINVLAQGQGGWGWVDDAWWQAQDASAYRAAAGGVRAMLGRVDSAVWTLIVGLCAAFGACVAVAQGRRPRVALALVALAPLVLAIGAAVLWPPSDSTSPWMWGLGAGSSTSRMLAARDVWMEMVLVTYLLSAAGLLGDFGEDRRCPTLCRRVDGESVGDRIAS